MLWNKDWFKSGSVVALVLISVATSLVATLFLLVRPLLICRKTAVLTKEKHKQIKYYTKLKSVIQQP